jgi:hypothetical protein
MATLPLVEGKRRIRTERYPLEQRPSLGLCSMKTRQNLENHIVLGGKVQLYRRGDTRFWWCSMLNATEN